MSLILPRAKKAADDRDDLDPERAPELVDAQIEAEEAIGEGAMDDGSDGCVDSDET